MFAESAFWAMIGLFLFIGVVIYFKVPGVIAGALDKRGQGISDELDHARKLREDAEALLAEYQRKAKNAEQEAAAILDQAKREAEALAGEAKKRMEDFVTSRTKMAEAKIAQAEAQAIQDVKALSADVAVGAASRILAAKVKGDAGKPLIDRAIGDVGSKLH
jgi:F-type H+-transporting ATPase subunit b